MPDFAVTRAAARAEIREGLLRTPPSISPKFFYDPVGSDLFERITRTPEYLTATLRTATFFDLNFSPTNRHHCARLSRRYTMDGWQHTVPDRSYMNDHRPYTLEDQAGTRNG